MQRTFIIGDKWLYYKLYTGLKTADTIITEIIGKLGASFMADGISEMWFFLRYNDPQFHIRWRIRVTDPEKISIIIDKVNKAVVPYVDNNMVYKVQIDTYKRELERYGHNTIEIIEQLFWQNSILVYDYLEMMQNSSDEKIRWLFSMRAIDSFLSEFKYTLIQKLNLLKLMADSYEKEFNINSPLINQLSARYRTYKQEIFRFMRFAVDEDSEFAALFMIIRDANERSIEAIHEILNLETEKNLKVSLDNLLISYIHMFMNRLFRSKQRLHEMVIYGFLLRYYRSQLAQSGNIKH